VVLRTTALAFRRKNDVLFAFPNSVHPRACWELPVVSVPLQNAWRSAQRAPGPA
jgi:hypothetical protein